MLTWLCSLLVTGTVYTNMTCGEIIICQILRGNTSKRFSSLKIQKERYNLSPVMSLWRIPLHVGSLIRFKLSETNDGCSLIHNDLTWCYNGNSGNFVQLLFLSVAMLAHTFFISPPNREAYNVNACYWSQCDCYIITEKHLYWPERLFVKDRKSTLLRIKRPPWS